MLRIGQVESSATADGKYTDGSVAGGIAATRLRAAAFNAIQEELANIVESAGMTLDPDDVTQVLAALKNQFLSRVNPFADIKADGAAAVASALANLGLGDAAKRMVGTGANQIPDMASFSQQQIGGVRIFRFPNGLCIQLGNSSADSTGGAVVSLPVAMSIFTPFVVEALVGNWSGSGNTYDFFTLYGAQGTSSTTFLAKSASYRGSDGKFVAQSTSFNWIAMGVI
ncbi:hypothetical protein QUG33_10385 [Citrobacter braakii]|jgi:ribosomal protein L12E/L44/L45/RPP1/RPP2|uniref:hypothetical protein n=1 Tax=Citrobacter braakii TaxID=57706 RepID=UPI0025A1C764|nr:hypothetical protein [Citrobacter braakii]MDM6729851.1 hypothetical protein [Citrobacter braakii]